MFTSQSEIAKSAMLKSIEIAYAVPQIIAHRVSRMALAGPVPSTRDRKEFQLMGTEKLAAVLESWSAMALATGFILHAVAIKNMASLTAPWSFTEPDLQPTTDQLSIAAISIFSKGVTPIHRRVMANAKRFGYMRRR